jgi:hypothetical protein
MPPRKGNEIVPITLPPFHREKLAAICKFTGLTKSGVIQRMLENYRLFEIKDDANKEAPST